MNGPEKAKNKLTIAEDRKDMFGIEIPKVVDEERWRERERERESRLGYPCPRISHKPDK